MHLVPSTGGVHVALHELGGDPNAPLLLFAHATGMHGRVFQPMVDAGLRDAFRCISADLRGHGDSVIPDVPRVRGAGAPGGIDFAWSGFRDDVLAVLDDVGTAPVHGVGHSMGGAALLMAELARPGTFAGLWLFEPIVPPPMLLDLARPNPMAEAAERRREVFPSIAAAVTNYAAKPPLNRFRADVLHTYVEAGFAPLDDGTVRIKCRSASEAATFRMAGSHDTYARLGEVGCPVTIAMGESMEMGPAAFAPAAVEALPQGRLERYQHLSHFGPLEAPHELASAVLQAFA
jgi:pimeloyl-ACP methyl ester carboxylesterase